jgi:4-amino-4-deoxy-L-arabinose transferase-like glycosyltransferase
VDVNALATLFMLLGCYFFARLRDEDGFRSSAATGVFMGLGALTRPDVVVALSAPAAGIILEKQRARKALVIALSAAVAVLSLWWARNFLVHGCWIPFTTTSPLLFWEGNNPLSQVGTLVTMDGHEVRAAMPRDLREKLAGCDELQRMWVFREEAMRCIRADPGAFARRLVRKAVNFWWFSPTFATKHYSWVGGWMVGVYKLFHLLVLVLACMGLRRALFRDGDDVRRLSLCMLAILLSQAFIHIVYYAETRHRLLVMPLLLALAGHGWVSVMDGLKNVGALPSGRMTGA